MTPISERHCARLYIYKKQKKYKTCIYIYIKQDNLGYVSIHKNPDSLRYEIFRKIFEIGIYIKSKSMTLCIT